MTKPEYEMIRANELIPGDKLSDGRVIVAITHDEMHAPYIAIQFADDILKRRYAAPYWTYEIEKRTI